MFEYWFMSAEGDVTFTGTTHDFLEVCCQLAKRFSESLAGEFLSEMLTEHGDKLEFLRVIDWKFDTSIATHNGDIVIRLHKTI